MDRCLPPLVDSLLRELVDESRNLEQLAPLAAQRLGQLADDLRASVEAARMFEVVR